MRLRYNSELIINGSKPLFGEKKWLGWFVLLIGLILTVMI